jgi:hypothetical protein
MLLLRVERLDKQRSWAVPKPLWLAWVGDEMPPLTEVCRLYLRRFAIDHWYRFAKQRLHWTLPKLSTPKQCERLQLFHNNTAHPDTLTDYPFFQRATQRGIAFVVTGFRRGLQPNCVRDLVRNLLDTELEARAKVGD